MIIIGSTHRSFFLSTFLRIISHDAIAFSAADKYSSIDVPFKALFNATKLDLYSEAIISWNH